MLLGEAPSPAERVAWVSVTDAWQLTLVDGDVAAGLRPWPTGSPAGRSGLVLAGGGARAFAHVGVLRELEDAGLHVDRVAGSSVGAIIAAAHATGVDGATLEEICYSEFVRRRPFSDYHLSGRSLAEGHRVRGAMERTLRCRHACSRGCPRSSRVVSVGPGEPHPAGAPPRPPRRRRPGLGAPARCSSPPIAPTTDASSSTAGVLDNLPTDLLVERDEGPVVAVTIGSGRRTALERGTRPAPRVPGLGDTLMRTMMIGSGGAAADAARRPWRLAASARRRWASACSSSTSSTG